MLAQRFLEMQATHLLLLIAIREFTMDYVRIGILRLLGWISLVGNLIVLDFNGPVTRVGT